ncbi:MAG TPA: type VI secretion system tip protein TssI/VgrG, partial [Burkholderiales bacterium]|nr:type VI secretion system tip protein TssI/VgrG [Burkholderiales bacterium]
MKSEQTQLLDRPPRTFELFTPLAPGVLLFHRALVTEALSQLSEFTLDMLSPNEDIDPDEMLGQRVSIRVELPGQQERRFTGYVTSFAHVGMLGRYHHYQADVRPWFWFLTRTMDCRIFQNQTVPEIIKAVFGEHALADFKLELAGAYRKRGYCVQYRESDFDFLSRLMEEEGIYYYFRHGERNNTLVLVDSMSAHSPFPGYEQLPFVPQGRLVRPEHEYVHAWEFKRAVKSGKVALSDYDFQRPSVDLQVASAMQRKHEQCESEIFDYPGTYYAGADGAHYAKTRVEALNVGHSQVTGKTNARGAAVGHVFTLLNHPRGDQNRQHLILAATHQMKNAEYETTDSTETAGAEYQCAFTAQDSKEPFRPARVTRKPFVQGPQTAVVTGPDGDEIHTDQFGRV